MSSGSSCELSELMKRRLESVASTGSSASSGFIEDKSYCDSEEEEEGKGQAHLTLLPSPLCLALPLSPSSSFRHLCSTSLDQEPNPLRLFSSLSLMGRFLLLFSSTITAAETTVTPLSLGRGLFISCPECCSALRPSTSAMSLLMCYF